SPSPSVAGCFGFIPLRADLAADDERSLGRSSSPAIWPGHPALPAPAEELVEIFPTNLPARFADAWPLRNVVRLPLAGIDPEKHRLLPKAEELGNIGRRHRFLARAASPLWLVGVDRQQFGDLGQDRRGAHRRLGLGFRLWLAFSQLTALLGTQSLE